MNTKKAVWIIGCLAVLLALSNLALAADPGTPPPFVFGAPGSDQKAGSVLVYNIYTSSVTAPALQNTKLSMTNTSDTTAVSIHLFFIDGASCSVADRYICLTANQTAVLLASEQDPATTGYLVAVATDFDGLPLVHNYLIGDEYVKFDTGHFASLGADAYAKNNNANNINGDGTLAAIYFDGLNLVGSYSAAPRVLAVDNIGSAADGNDTLLIFNSLSGNLTAAAQSVGSLFGILYNDAEQPHSFNFNAGCQFRLRMNDAFPRTAPRFSQVIPAGQTGWMKFWPTTPNRGISGVVITKTSTAGAGSFNEGHTLHVLKTEGQPAITPFVIPVFPPSC